ncbi:MAG: AMP-binding protein, partial [Solirubrobacteraceae bacterium]
MESITTTAAAQQAADAATVAQALRRTAFAHPEIVAVRTIDDSVSLTWAQLCDRADALAGGLAGLGVGRGDCVALMLSNRPEFHVADLAAVTLGAVPFSIYLTYPAEEIEFLVRDSGARVLIVEQAFLPVVLEARQNLPELDHVIVIDGEAQEGVTALAEVEGANPGFDAESAATQVSDDEICTLIYTSGTTGPPKGVQLTHRSVMFAARTVREVMDFPAGARVISWLPSAHIAERMAHHYVPVVYAGTVTCAPNPREVVSYLPQVRPNWFFAVPRIWEKLKSGLEGLLASLPDEQRIPAQAGLEASLERVRLRQRGQPVPAELEAKVAATDEQMFSKLRTNLGLDQLLAVNAGAA